MIKQWAKRLGFLVGAVGVLKLAAAFAVIAAAFAAYAALAMRLTPAEASAATALIFAVVVLICALSVPPLLRFGGARPSRRRGPAATSTGSAQSAFDMGVTVAGLVSAALLERRERSKARRKARRAKAKPKRAR